MLLAGVLHHYQLSFGNLIFLLAIFNTFWMQRAKVNNLLSIKGEMNHYTAKGDGSLCATEVIAALFWINQRK